MHGRSVATDDEESASWCTDCSAASEPGGVRRLEWPDGARYEGLVNDHYLPHGEGELRTTRGDVFKGKWHQGWISGQGTFVNSRGTHFCGELQKNQRNGQGTLTCANGAIYTGNWRDDMPDGHGTYVDEVNGVNYTGSWNAGKAQGWGVLKVQSWGTYKGQFLEDKKHGQGHVTYNNGATYEGEWDGDEAHGWGQYHWPNGDVYEGQFHRGHMTGQGEYRSERGSFVFKGEWHQNKRKGMGHVMFSDGAEYDGEWADDRPEGLGVFKSPLGIIFRGLWRGGVFCPRSAGYDERGLPTVVVESGRYSLGNSNGLDVVHPAVVPGSCTSTNPANLPDPAIAWQEGFAREDNSRDFDTSVYESRLYPADPCKLESGYLYRTRFHVRMWNRDNDENSKNGRGSSTPIDMDETHRFGRQINNISDGGEGIKDDIPLYQRNQAYPYKHRPVLPSTNVGDSAFMLRPIMVPSGDGGGLNSSIPSSSFPTSSIYRDVEPVSERLATRAPGVDVSGLPVSIADGENIVPTPTPRNPNDAYATLHAIHPAIPDVNLETQDNLSGGGGAGGEGALDSARGQQEQPQQSPWRPMSTQHYSIHEPDEDDTCDGSEKLEWSTGRGTEDIAQMRTVETTDVPVDVQYQSQEEQESLSSAWRKENEYSVISDSKEPTPAPIGNRNSGGMNSPLNTSRVHGPSSFGEEQGIAYRPPRPSGNQYHEPDKQVTLPDRVDTKEECVNDYLVGSNPMERIMTDSPGAVPLITNNNYYYPTNNSHLAPHRCCCWCHPPPHRSEPEHVPKSDVRISKPARKWQSVSSPLISFRAAFHNEADGLPRAQATPKYSRPPKGEFDVEHKSERYRHEEEVISHKRKSEKVSHSNRERDMKDCLDRQEEHDHHQLKNVVVTEYVNASEFDHPESPNLKDGRRTSYANTSTTSWTSTHRAKKFPGSAAMAVVPQEEARAAPTDPTMSSTRTVTTYSPSGVVPKAARSFYRRTSPVMAPHPPYIPPPRQVIAPQGVRAWSPPETRHHSTKAVERTTTTTTACTEHVSRMVPVPIEASSTVHFVLPRIRSTVVPVDVPVYAPRFVEVPVGVESLEKCEAERCEAMAKKLAKARRSGDGAALEHCANEMNRLTADLRNTPSPTVDLSKFLPPADHSRTGQ